MKELNLDTGLVTYSINGKVELTFNPSDADFARNLYSAINHLETKHKEYQKMAQKVDAVEFFDLSKKIDKEMREIIDEAFKQPICDTLFGSMNLYSMANGLPVWCRLFLAIIDEMDGAAAAERNKMKAAISKYTAKYNKSK